MRWLPALRDPARSPGPVKLCARQILNALAQSYGGAIQVYSENGQGTTFNVYIPAVKQAAEIEPITEAVLPRGNEHILLVDDESVLIEVGQKMLEMLGYKVTPCNDSLEALSIFRQAPDAIDLVLTDMTMPNMTGDKLACALMQIRPDIPVILCTGYSKKINREKALDIGIEAFLYKPIVGLELAQTVRKVLDNR